MRPEKHQRKASLVAIICVCGWLAFFNIFLPPPESLPATDGEVKLSGLIGSITLHNTLDRPFAFLSKPLNEDVQPKKQTLAAGECVGFSGNFHVEITLLPESLCLIYWLFPGERYVVRDIGDDGDRIFKMVHGDASAVSLAPHVPTPDFVIERILELTGVFSESVVYDLGCGDGRVLIRAAEKYGIEGVGVDIDPHLIKQARKAASAAGVASRVRFFTRDIFKTDLSKATLVYLYLFPDSLNLLRPYLEDNLKKGTMVACFSFAIPGWEEKLVAQHKIEGDFIIPKIIYIYR
jgi:SAM-dependent methyltransferase